MMGRVRGFVLIVNTLLPFLVIVGLGALAWQTASNIEHAWVGTCDKKGKPAGCLKGIEPALNDIVVRTQKSVKQTQAAVAKSKAKVSAAFKKMGKAKKKVDKVFTGISKLLSPIEKIKLANIGPTVTKPLRSVVNAITALATPLKDLEAAAAEMVKLEKLQGQMEAMQRDIGHASARMLALGRPIGDMARLVAWLSGILALWLGFSYLIWAYGRLATGLAMIRG
jgi:hypothetical protein